MPIAWYSVDMYVNANVMMTGEANVENPGLAH